MTFPIGGREPVETHLAGDPMTRLPRPMAWILLWGGAALPITACSGPSPGDADGVRPGPSNVGSEGANSRVRESDAPVRVPFLTKDAVGRPLGGVTNSVVREGTLGHPQWPRESDACGNYELEVVPGRYKLVATVDGFVSVQRSFEVSLEAREPMPIVFERGLTIRGRLIDAWGVGVPFQEIWSAPSSGGGDRFWGSYSWGVTDRDGAFALPGLAGDPVSLSLYNEGRYPPPELARTYEGVLPGSDDVVMELADDGRVLVHPVDAVTGYPIVLLDTDPESRLGVDPRCRLAVGWKHELQVSGYVPAEVDLRGPVATTGTEFVLPLERLDFGGELTVLAVDPGGDPISDVEIYIDFFNSPWLPRPEVLSETGEVGVFRFRGLSSQKVRLILRSPRFEKAEVWIDWNQGEEREIQVVMERHWPVETAFVDAGGHDVWHTHLEAEGDVPRCGTLNWIKRGVPAAHFAFTSLGRAWSSKFDHCGPRGTAIFPAQGEYVLRTRLGQSDWREHRVWVDEHTGLLTLIP